MTDNRPAVPNRQQIEDDPGQSLYQIEQALRELEHGGGKAIMAVRQAREDLATARHELRLKRAQVYVKAKQLRRDDGKPSTAQERDVYLDEHTDAEQFAVDIAEAAVQYARDTANDREGVRSSLQTRAKMVIEALRLAGWGGVEPDRNRRR